MSATVYFDRKRSQLTYAKRPSSSHCAIMSTGSELDREKGLPDNRSKRKSNGPDQRGSGGNSRGCLYHCSPRPSDLRNTYGVRVYSLWWTQINVLLELPLVGTDNLTDNLASMRRLSPYAMDCPVRSVNLQRNVSLESCGGVYIWTCRLLTDSTSSSI